MLTIDRSRYRFRQAMSLCGVLVFGTTVLWAGEPKCPERTLWVPSSLPDGICSEPTGLFACAVTVDRRLLGEGVPEIERADGRLLVRTEAKTVEFRDEPDVYHRYLYYERLDPLHHVVLQFYGEEINVVLVDSRDGKQTWIWGVPQPSRDGKRFATITQLHDLDIWVKAETSWQRESHHENFVIGWVTWSATDQIEYCYVDREEQRRRPGRLVRDDDGVWASAKLDAMKE